MVQVSSPPLSSKVPQSLAKTPEERVFWKNVNDFLFRLWKRSGGSSDLISDQGAREAFSFPKITHNGKVFDVIALTADHTTSGNEILICNNTSLILVTCNATPDDEEEIIIKRRNSAVDVIATKGIDGETTKKRIVTSYDSPHLIFTGEAGEYSII